MGKYSEVLLNGYRLIGLLNVLDAVKEVPIEVIAQLINRVHLWTIQKLPEAYTSPSKNVSDKENSLRWVSKCKLSSLTEWLRDEFNSKLEAGKS